MDRRFFLLGGISVLAGCASTDLQTVGAVSSDSRTVATYMARLRASQGLQPLTPDAALERAAAQQAQYMARAGKMAHTAGWGKSFSRRMASAGVRTAAAENIAYGQRNHAEVMQSWMNSAGHRRNMLNPAYSRYGLASVSDARGRRYWAMVLAA